MANAVITEADLKGAAEKALHGDKAAAVAAVVSTLAGAFTGHPILGVALGSGAEWFVKGVVDRATQRLVDADRAYDDERERVAALARELADGLAPLWAHALEDLSAQSSEQFLQTLKFVERNVASAAGQEELLAAVEKLELTVEDLVNRGEAARQAEGRAWSVFVAYSSKDVKYRDAFRAAARRLELAGVVSVWCDAETRPGEAWAQSIREKLDSARLVVALVSPDFLESSWCLSELARTFELRERKLVDVVPVVVRQCDWRKTSLGAIQALPRGGAPIETVPDSDVAWREVVAGVERILMEGERVQPALPSRDSFIQHCTDVLDAGQRLMLLAPWRSGIEELAQEIARRSHGDAVTTLRLPALEDMASADFYAEVSGEPSVSSHNAFRQWLIRRSMRGSSAGRHLVVLPYFGGPRALVKELGHVTRGLFDQTGSFSLLVLGLARCASLLREVDQYSLFSGIMTEHVPGMDLKETGTLLTRVGADAVYAMPVREATGGHPEWTALTAPEVRRGNLDGLAQHLSDRKLFGVLRERLMVWERERQGSAHAAHTLEKLLNKQRVVRLSDAGNDLTYPEVRLYYDGILEERDEQSVFRCEAARIASTRALEVWRRQP